MLAEAFADTGVRTVIAHTLAHRNASNRVLEKAGFHHDAETVQDGEVIWRFSVTRRGTPEPEPEPVASLKLSGRERWRPRGRP